MRTLITLSMCWLALFSSPIFAQNKHGEDHHHGVEVLLQNYTYGKLLRELDIPSSAALSEAYQQQIDLKYQSFCQRIKQQHQKYNEREVALQFNELVTRLKEEKKGDKGGGPVTPKIINGPCVNMDFEDGTLNGWTLTRGEVPGTAPYSFTGEYATGPSAHHLVVNGGNDPVTGIPRNNPMTGAFSVRLGDGTGIGAQAARMKQTFLVDSNNYLFTYSYAVIFESPNNHLLNELPYFTVRVFDQLGNNAPCGEYSVIASPATAQEYSVINYGGSTVLYKNWETVFANLESFIGQNVTIEFTTGDCSKTGHYGYAYVDASCVFDKIISADSALCTGDSMLLTAPSGAATYAWSNGANTQSTYVTTGGNYSCTLTPYQGGTCSLTLDIDVNEIASPTAQIAAIPSTICLFDSIQFTNTSFIDSGSITGYAWDFGDYILIPLGTTDYTSIPQTSGNPFNLQHQYAQSGTFIASLVAQAANGCMDTANLTVTVLAPPPVLAPNDTTICENEIVSLNATGAHTYSWSNGLSNGANISPAVGSHNFTVIGTDTNGCSDTTDFSVEVLPLPTLDAGAPQVLCDTIDVYLNAVSTGTIVWSNGIQNGVPFQPGVGLHQYFVTASLNGCTQNDSTTVLVHPLTTVDAGNDLFYCDSPPAILSGTAQNYAAVSWSGGNGSFSPPNQLNTQYSPTNTDLTIGTFPLVVTATSPHGCPSASDTILLTYNHFAHGVAVLVDSVSCHGGSDGAVTLTVTNPNNGPFSYSLNNGPSVSSPTFSNLSAGTHQIVITNAAGCDTSINFTVFQPTPLQLALLDKQDLRCFEDSSGSLEIGISGALPPYQINWVNPGLTGTFNDSLPAGNYSVNVEDLNGCLQNMNIAINQPNLLIANPVVDSIQCFGGSATIYTNVSGGVTPYTYTWNGITGDDTGIVPPGVMIVIATDAHNCSVSDTFHLLEPEPLAVVLPNDTTVCMNFEAQVQGLVSGGTGGYQFNWSNQPGNNSAAIQFNVSSNMTILLSVTDDNNCTANDQMTLNVFQFSPEDLLLSAGKTAICLNDSVSLHYTYNGQTPMASISWVDCASCIFPRWVAITQDTVFYAQLISICSDTATTPIALDMIEVPHLSMGMSTVPVCPRQSFEIQLYGDVDNQWTYAWSISDMYYGNGSSIQATLPSPGMYAVQVTAVHTRGCVYDIGLLDSILVHPEVVADFEIDKDEKSFLDATFYFTNQSINATNYFWTFGDGYYSTASNPEHTYDAFGEFLVQLISTSAQGCRDTIIKPIKVLADHIVYVPNAFTPDDDQHNPVFMVRGHGISPDDFEFLIFNRWGEIIFETNDINEGWDGTSKGGTKDVQDGSFPWKLKYKSLDGASHVKVGHVMLLK